MKFFHLSDLHIGKHLHHYNLKEDQEAVLNQIVQYAIKERPDAIVIAGDIYDKSAPSGEAVGIFDEFLTQLSEILPVIPVLVISGNHDSARRLDFASAILNKHCIHIVGMPPGSPEEYIQRVTLTDAYGEVNFYLLPFVKPGYVRGVFSGETVDSYDLAVRRLIEREEIDRDRRNVLVSHQFYTAGEEKPEISESEMVNVGGMDNVDCGVLEVFDYVALGHIHGPQSMGKPWIRYCGTPLKYSVSECNHRKSITVVTLLDKGNEPIIETIPLKPLYDIRKLEGTLSEIMASETEERCEDYVSITLTDETELYKPKDILRERYERILQVKVDNSRTRAMLENMEDIDLVTDPFVVFSDFFQEMQGRTMNEEEEHTMQQFMEHTKEGEAY